MKAKKENCKPQSDLQKLNSLTNWAIYFCLREFPGHFVYRLGLSTSTVQRISTYNANVRMLRAAIKKDYLYRKEELLKERKRLAKLSKK